MLVIPNPTENTQLFIPRNLLDEFIEYRLTLKDGAGHEIEFSLHDQTELTTYYVFTVDFSNTPHGEYEYTLSDVDGNMSVSLGLISLGLNYKNQTGKVYEPRK